MRKNGKSHAPERMRLWPTVTQYEPMSHNDKLMLHKYKPLSHKCTTHVPHIEGRPAPVVVVGDDGSFSFQWQAEQQPDGNHMEDEANKQAGLTRIVNGARRLFVTFTSGAAGGMCRVRGLSIVYRLVFLQ